MTLSSHAARFDRFDVLKACRSAFLEQLSTLLRDSRLVSEAAIGAVVAGVGRHFDAMQVSQQRTGSFEEEVRGLTSSRITLVGDDDLELNIRFDKLCTALTESTNVQLWKTHLRFMTLLGRPHLRKTQNPVGPEGIIAGLQSLFAAAGASSLDEKLDLLDRLEALLREGLPVIYTRIDALLDQFGTEAAQPAIVGAAETPRPAAATAAPAQAPAAATGPSASGILAQLAGKGARTGQPVPGGRLLSQAALDNLMFRLDQLERSHRNNTDFLTATSPKLETLIPGLFADAPESTAPSLQAVRAHELGVPAATAEGQAIDAIGQFYSAVFADPELPETLKLLLAEIQIIMVRLALKDKTLFSRADHPLRLLIDRIGEVFIAVPVNADRQHPVCRKLSDALSRLKGGFGGNTEEGIRIAADSVSELLAEQQREISGQAAAYMPLLQQLDRQDQAAADLRRLLETREISALPPVLEEFIRREWKHLLMKAWFEGGSDGPLWQSHARTLSSLLWTFRPKADGEERKALARELPRVIKSIKAGMEQLGMSADAQSRVLDACFELQTRAMRPSGSASSTDQQGQDGDVPAGRPESQQMAQGRIESGGLVLHTLDFPAPVTAGLPGALPSPGVWLSVRLDGVEHALWLSHRSPDSGRSLLFNPGSRLALSIHPQLLDMQLRNGSIRQLGNPPLFAYLLSRALEAAT